MGWKEEFSVDVGSMRVRKGLNTTNLEVVDNEEPNASDSIESPGRVECVGEEIAHQPLTFAELVENPDLRAIANIP